ncbi:MAG: gliding motility lipoprotein GldH [Saprospiraceae bacterium]
MKNKNRITSAWPALLLIVFAACGPNYFFEENKPIANGQWAYADTLDFRFAIEDTLETYNMYLDFEYADTFSTQNIYLKLHTRFPDGKRLGKQKSFDLFSPEGQPLGKCSGGNRHLRTVLQERAFFNQRGEYVITLEQFTRSNPLPGVLSVGLALEATGVRR